MNYDPDNSRRPYLRPLYDGATVADLKMPESNVLDQMATEIARKLAADQDALIRRNITRRIGEGWTLESVLPRLRWEQERGQPGKMLLLDDEPLLFILPPEHTDVERVDRSRYMNYTIRYQEMP